MYRFLFYHRPLDLGPGAWESEFLLGSPQLFSDSAGACSWHLKESFCSSWLPLSQHEPAELGGWCSQNSPQPVNGKSWRINTLSFAHWVRQVWGYIPVSQNPPMGLSCPQCWPTRTHTCTQSQPTFISWVLPPRIQPIAGQKYLKRKIPESCKSKTWICCALERIYIAFI